MDERLKLERVRRQVAALKGFYVHLAIFALVMSVLFVINALGRGRWWVQWPFLGWGVGVLGHAAGVFGRSPGYLARWEENKVAELMRRPDPSPQPAQTQMPSAATPPAEPKAP